MKSNIKKTQLYFFARAALKECYYAVKKTGNGLVRLIRPQRPPLGSAKIHLGCGPVKLEGFINVDGVNFPHVHYVHDLGRLPFIPDGTAELIYSCHALEHFPPSQTESIIREWARTLKKGGLIRLSVPDFDKLTQFYLLCDKDASAICAPLLGYGDGYASHIALFNKSHLEKILLQCGFSDIAEWSSEAFGYDDWSSRKIEFNEHKMNISLNLEATKC